MTTVVRRIGFLAIGRRRPGFDPDWARIVGSSAWQALDALFEPVRPSQEVVDDGTLRQALVEFRREECEALLVLQPTMGDGRLAPMLAQLWDGPIVLWATPERPDADRVTACSLVGTHVYASIFRQMHRSFELVYGAPDNETTQEQLLRAVSLACAVSTVGQAKIGLIGYHAPGFVNIHADPMALHHQLGVELLHIGLMEFQDRMAGLADQRIDADFEHVIGMQLPRDPEISDDDLVPNCQYFLALNDLLAEENLSAVALRCWPELPAQIGHWPYLAMMRLAEEGKSVVLEGDVDGAILSMIGSRLEIGVGYVSDWLEHNEEAITLWHPGHAPRDYCVSDSVSLARHFNNDKPLVVNAQLRPDLTITLARLWRCDERYHLTAFVAGTESPRQRLLGAYGRARVEGGNVPDLFENLCRAGMPHHVTVFKGDHVQTLRRLADRLNIRWVEASGRD